jgi:hypothetical protein
MNGMRFLTSFTLIGAGAFAAGVFYSQSSYDNQGDHWLFFAASTAASIAGLIDSVALALRSQRPRL